MLPKNNTSILSHYKFIIYIQSDDKPIPTKVEMYYIFFLSLIKLNGILYIDIISI